MTKITGQNRSTNECSCDCSVFSPELFFTFWLQSLFSKRGVRQRVMFYHMKPCIAYILMYNSLARNVQNKIILTFMLAFSKLFKRTIPQYESLLYVIYFANNLHSIRVVEQVATELLFYFCTLTYFHIFGQAKRMKDERDTFDQHIVYMWYRYQTPAATSSG